MNNQENLSFPIGKFAYPKTVTASDLEKYIQEIADLPTKVRATVQKMTESELETPYRPDGWTVRQVVHHLADSHGNAFFRFKFALTEESPSIKPYKEDLWAKLPDYQLAIEVSLSMLENIHLRWVAILKHMTESDFARTFFHPALEKTLRLDIVTPMYVWHGNHHLAHILLVKNK
ncbi:MAG: putative metal-dependent hydrolase [Bacteroidetes bacterium]|nr:MAG: putative metal-dependent hydrolase [Bacteroidota bacterium]